MADFRKRDRSADRSKPEDAREAEARTREQFGIGTLTEEEELIDESTFSRMHARLAAAGGGADGEGHAKQLEDELLLEEIATELPVGSRAPKNASDALVAAAGPGEVSALEAQIRAAKSRDEVARLALRIALVHARAAALLVVNRGVIAGLCGAGEGIASRVEGVMIPAESDSLFARPVAEGKPFRGSLPPTGVDRRVLRALGRGDACEVALLPIRIGSRVVNLLYADNGPHAISDTGLAALRALGVGVARAYERLILERKRSGPAGAG